MKLALIHDYLNEFGGAERVLLALSEIWPRAPIYTAFYKKGSPAWQRFKDKDVRVSFAQKIPFFPGKLHSPLRFLAPKIWGSVAQELKDYDVVISSASWYVTKGFGVPIEICYCHTPPRWLYGIRLRWSGKSIGRLKFTVWWWAILCGFMIMKQPKR